MKEKNVSLTLDNTTDDIQEARDDNGGDDARALQEMVVLNSRGLAKETRGSSSLCLRPMNPSNHHAKASGRTLSSGGLQGGMSFCDNQYFPSSWKNEGHTLLSLEFESFCMERTQGEVNHVDGQFPRPNVLDDLLGVSSTTFRMTSYVSVAHQWISTRPLSTGRPNYMHLCECSRWTMTQTLSFGGIRTSKSSHAWPA